MKTLLNFSATCVSALWIFLSPLLAGSVDCAKRAYSQDVAAKKKWQKTLRDFIVQEKPEFKELATLSTDLQLTYIDTLEARFSFLLKHHPERIITNQGLSKFRNFDWSDDDKKTLMKNDPRYKKLEEKLSDLKLKNNSATEWPKFREYYRNLANNANYKKLLNDFEKKEKEIESFLNGCQAN